MLAIDDLDIEGAFADRPLDDATLRCLQYMHDIESHTVCYLRDLLVTRAHEDPAITTFLTMWSYEEHWHGEAIARVLAVHRRAGGPERVAEVRRALPRSTRVRPILFTMASEALPALPAVHLTWGAVNEWTTQAGYARLAAEAGHPVLTELLRRIMRDEGGHIRFYATEAKRRLEASAAARRLTRFALRRFWAPVGSGVRPEAETAFVVRHLLAGPEGAAVAWRIDRSIDRMPGLAGLSLVTKARTRYVATSEKGDCPPHRANSRAGGGGPASSNVPALLA